MLVNNQIMNFENNDVRVLKINGERYMPAIDVATSLGYLDPKDAASKIINRNPERFKGWTKCLLLESQKGKQQTTVLNLRGIVAFCMLSRQPKAIPFQRWADQVIEKELKKVEQIRIKSKQVRNEFTDTLKFHGCRKPEHYINITKSMKDRLGIEPSKKKGKYEKVELLMTMASEAVASVNMIKLNADGYRECKEISSEACTGIEMITNSKTMKQTRVTHGL